MNRVLVTLAAAVLSSGPALAGTANINPVQDTTIYEACDPECADGGSNAQGVYLFAGRTSNFGVRRILVRYDVAAIVPAGATITSARFILNDATPPVAEPGLQTFTLHRMTAAWGTGTSDAGDPGGNGAPPTSGDAAWEHAFYSDVLWSAPGAEGDYVAAPSATRTYDSTGTQTWGSTSLTVADVQGWLDQPKTNHGWILIGTEDTPTTARRFDSVDTAQGTMPRLNLAWDDPPIVLQFSEQTATRFPTPNPAEYTNQLTTGDVDGDGDLDIVFANGEGFGGPGSPLPARLYINDGTGVFSDASAAQLGGVTGFFRGAEMGDIDADGDLDLILVQDFANPALLLINDGTGTFNDESGERLPAMNLSSSRAQFGDVDNDGDLDLFITTGTTTRFTCGQYRLYVNDGTGVFTDDTANRVPTGAVCNNMDCIFGDIDNDFDIDIRTGSTGTNNSRLYVNDGTGVFALADIPADSSCYSYDFGDIDGDGDLDLLGANGGTGNSERLYVNGGAGDYTVADGQIQPNPSIDDNDSKFLDIDNDGDLDLIVGALGSNSERIYINDGDGDFALTDGLIDLVSDSTLDIMVADYNGDGATDIVTAQGESGNFQNRIYINTGPADTVPPTIVATEALPDTMDATGPYIVRALVLDGMSSDRNFFDHGIRLHYTVDDGSEQQVDMRHSGGQVYRGALPGQPAGGLVTYWVSATDFNDNTGTGQAQVFAVTTDTLAIVGSVPPPNAIDARQPHAIDAVVPAEGWSAVVLEFNGAVDGIVAADFELTQDGMKGMAPAIVDILPAGDHTIELTLAGPIAAGAWTTITHLASGTSTRLGYLPADVNGDGASGPLDILALVDALNGVVSLPLHGTDINRSGLTEPQDILRTIDLLNGAGQYTIWNGRTLPD